jgi:hypothetical protein
MMRLLRACAGLGILLLVVLALAGCVEPDSIAAVPATATPHVPLPTEAPRATPTPKPTAADFPLAAPSRATIEQSAHQTCVGCHTSEEMLKGSIATEEGAVSGTEGLAWASELPSEAAWELVYLGDQEFLETMHGRYGCITCHGGTGDTLLKEVAHTGLIREPSAAGLCGDCHADEVSTAEYNLHASLAGYRTVLFMRSDSANTDRLETMIGNHCDPCHAATCGQCHVSRPAGLGGGLVAGHLFRDTGAINVTCAGCHGSRIEDEYKGQTESEYSDVHWARAKMLCTDCHVAPDFHGTEEEHIHRYDGRLDPSCDASGCHPDVAEDDGIAQHGDSHLKNLSCQACHATAYKNCYGCHVSVEDGTPGFTLGSVQMAFKIGRNPIQGRYRPWKYVPVRHVPIDQDSFSYYGEDLLPNFDALPTWKHATPHTIQRITPQNESCNACHGNAQVFLTADDVAPEELNANKRVIVEEIPGQVE